MRPEFIPRDAFRAYYSIGGLGDVMSIAQAEPANYIRRRAAAGRPIRSVKDTSTRVRGGMLTLYRPIDVVAAARADCMTVDPPERARLAGEIARLRYELKQLVEQRAAFGSMQPHSMHYLNQESASLTGHRLLSHEEIITKASALAREHFTGVYFLIHHQTVVYVGQAVNIPSRVAHHRGTKAFDSMAYIPCAPEHLDVIESLYIHSLRPRLNGRLASGEPNAPLSWKRLLNHAAELSNRAEK